MSSKRLSKRRDSRQLQLVTQESGLRFHSDNDLTAARDFSCARAASAAVAATAAAAAATAATTDFGSSCSVQTASGSSLAGSDTQVPVNGIGSSSSGGRGRAESLELGGPARGSFVRSSLAARDLHPNGIFKQRGGSGSSESVGGGSSQLLLSGSRGSGYGVANSYLTVDSARASQRLRRASELRLDPAEHERMLRRYHELRDLLAAAREQKLAREDELECLRARERELTSRQPAAGGADRNCVATQFMLAVDAAAESDADSALSVELDRVRQDVAVQKAVVEAHVRLLREAKTMRQPRHVRKQRAADYQSALEKLSVLNLKSRTLREQMSDAEFYDDDTISQSSSFAFCRADAVSLAASSSAYHSASPRNEGCSESLLSGQLYDARSLVSDLSRESSVRSAVSANAYSSASVPLPHAPDRQPPLRRHDADAADADPTGPPPIVPRRSGLGPNSRAGSKWRRSNSMGNLLGDQQLQYQPQPQPQYQPQPQPRYQPQTQPQPQPQYQSQPESQYQSQYQPQPQQQPLPQPQQQPLPQPQSQPQPQYQPQPLPRHQSQQTSSRAPVNTSFPVGLPPSQLVSYRRVSGADRSLSYRYEPRQSLDPNPIPRLQPTAPGPQTQPQLSASHQSPYWYTPRAQLEPAVSQAVQRHRKQYSDL